MKHDDWITSDTMRALAKILPPDDPNNPINLARAAAAAESAARAQQATQLSAAPSPDVAEPQPPPAKPRRKRRLRSRRVAAPAPPNESALERHQRLCTICNHEDREAIEEEFVNWYPPDATAEEYGIEWRAIYRHAHATGIFSARERNLRSALGHIVEQANSVTPTIDGVLRAIRAYSCLDRDGRWTEPPARVVVSSGSHLAPETPLAQAPRTIDLPSPEVSVLIDNESE